MGQAQEIQIDDKVAYVLREFLDTNKNLGYDSIDEFGDHALRRFLLLYNNDQHPPHNVEEAVELQR